MADSGEAWKYALRVSLGFVYFYFLTDLSTFCFCFQQSSETLFVTLFKEFGKCVSIFVSMMQMWEGPITDIRDHARILAKDALYNAAGIVACELYDEVCRFYKILFVLANLKV